MKLKYDFVVRNVAGQSVALAVGEDSANFNGMIKLNSVGEFIFKKLATDTTFEDILSSITNEYDITAEAAKKSVEDYIQILRTNGLLEE